MTLGFLTANIESVYPAEGARVITGADLPAEAMDDAVVFWFVGLAAPAIEELTAAVTDCAAAGRATDRETIPKLCKARVS